MKYIVIISFLCFSCSQGNNETVDPSLRVEYMNDDRYDKWITIGETPWLDAEVLGIGRNKDVADFHNLNPEYFIPTDLSEKAPGHIKSLKTGLVYCLTFQKGDTLIRPNPSIERTLYDRSGLP